MNLSADTCPMLYWGTNHVFNPNTGGTGYVGIGKNPTVALDVVGSATITGTVTANAFVGSISGANFTGSGYISTSGYIYSSNYVSAPNLYGYLNGNISGSSTSCSGNAASASVAYGLSGNITTSGIFTINGSSNVWAGFLLASGYHGSGFMSTIYYHNIGCSLFTAASINIPNIFFTSDIRIKKNIQPADAVLPLIQQLPIVSYDNIDLTVHKEHTSYGVVAQHIQNIFPEVVTTRTGFIPNIDRLVTEWTYTDSTKKYIQIIFPTPLDLLPADTIRIHILNKKNETSEEKSIIIHYLSDDKCTIQLPVWTELLLGDSFYLYGKQVDDFHSVDKTNFGLIAIKGIQELASQVASQAQTIQDLTNKNTQLQSDLLETRNQLTSLLAWATSQGFTA